jgi:hypothetical protein
VAVARGSDIGLIKNLGKTLFTTYVIPFEISSILFLSAMVGAVVIGKKDEQLSKESSQESSRTDGQKENV